MTARVDRFARQSDKYARHRPRYPDALFEYIAGLCERRKLAWDCATGTGQAAVGLARHFDRVVATDASAGQIAHAQHDPRVEYRIALAQESALPGGSVDLVTVATALHWLDLDAFYAEVRRVLRPRATVAVWGYQDTRVNPAIDAALKRYRSEIVGDDWAFEVRLLTERYRTIPFPFDEITAVPEFTVRGRWSLEDAYGYLESWSATQRYRDRTGSDPLTLIRPELRAAWGADSAIHEVEWPLFMRVGRNMVLHQL